LLHLQGFRYFLTTVDDFSLYTWTIFLHSKSKVRTHLIKFVAYIENQFNTKVKTIYSNNGAEFAMKSFLPLKA